MPEFRSKWSKKVSGYIATVLSDKKSLEKRMESLEALQPYLAINKLEYSSPEEESVAKDLLLQLWDNLVTNVFVVDSDYRATHYHSIWGIINHKELEMTANGYLHGDDKIDPNIPGHKIIMRYKELLVKTWNICSGVFVKAAMALQDETFCLQMCVVCYISFEAVREEFNKYFSSQTPPCSDDLTPICRLKDVPFVYEDKMKEDPTEKNIFFIKHKVDKAHFPKLTDLCEYCETGSKKVTELPLYSESCDKYRKSNPNLFSWDNIPCELKLDFKYLDDINHKPHFCFGFVRIMMEHYKFKLPEPIQWEYIPSYFLILRFILPQIQESIVGSYSIGQLYKDIPSNTYLSANRCALALLKNVPLLNVIISISFEPCSIKKVSDVESAMHTLELCFEEIKQKYDSSHYEKYLEILNKIVDDLENAITPTPRTPTSCEKKRLQFVAVLCDIPQFSFPFYMVKIKNGIYPRCFDLDKAIEWAEQNRIADNEEDAKELMTAFAHSVHVTELKTTENPPQTFYYVKEHRHHHTHRFKYLDEGKWNLPKSFNFKYFYDLISRLLSQDQYQIAIRVITFLYHSVDAFHSSQRVQLLDNLILETHFWSLFTHWYFLVRDAFMTFLVYKLFRTKRTKLPTVTPIQIIEMMEMSEEDYDLMKVTSGGNISNASTINLPHMLSSSNSYHFRNSSYKNGRNSSSSRISRLASHISTVYSTITGNNEIGDNPEIFVEALDHEAVAIDIMISSKLDSLIQTACDQLNEPNAELVPKECRVYVKDALIQYIEKLKKYFGEAKKVGKDDDVPCPNLEYVSPKLRNDI